MTTATAARALSRALCTNLMVAQAGSGRARSARRNRHNASPDINVLEARQQPGLRAVEKRTIPAETHPLKLADTVACAQGCHLHSEQPQRGTGGTALPPPPPGLSGFCWGSEYGKYSGVIANAGPHSLKYILSSGAKGVIPPGDAVSIPKEFASFRLLDHEGQELTLDGWISGFCLEEQQHFLVATFPDGELVLQRSQGLGEQERWCTEDGVDVRDRAASGCWLTSSESRPRGIEHMTRLANGAAGKKPAPAGGAVGPSPGTTAADATMGFMDRLLGILRSILRRGDQFYTEEELLDPKFVAAVKALQSSPYIPMEFNRLLGSIRQRSSQHASAEQDERQQQLDTPEAALADQVRQNWEAYESTHPPYTLARSRSSSSRSSASLVTGAQGSASRTSGTSTSGTPNTTLNAGSGSGSSIKPGTHSSPSSTLDREPLPEYLRLKHVPSGTPNSSRSILNTCSDNNSSVRPGTLAVAHGKPTSSNHVTTNTTATTSATTASQHSSTLSVNQPPGWTGLVYGPGKVLKLANPTGRNASPASWANGIRQPAPGSTQDAVQNASPNVTSRRSTNLQYPYSRAVPDTRSATADATSASPASSSSSGRAAGCPQRPSAPSEQHRASTCTSPTPPPPSSASPVPTATITTSAGSQLPPLFLDDLMTIEALYVRLAGLDPGWVRKVVVDLAGWTLGGKPPLLKQFVTPAGIHVTLKNGSLDLQPGRYLEVGPGGKLRLEGVQIFGAGVPDMGLVHVVGEGASAVLNNCSVTCNLDQYSPVTGHQERCHAVVVTGGGQACLTNCTLSAASGDGLKVHGPRSFASADDCTAQHCGMSGFVVGDDTASMALKRCKSADNQGHGFVANGPGTVLTALSCAAFDNGGGGFCAFTSAKLVAQKDCEAQESCMAGGNGKSGFMCVGVRSHLEAGPGCESHSNRRHGYSALAGGHLYVRPECRASCNQGAGFHAASDRLAGYAAAGIPIIAQSVMQVSKRCTADANVKGESQQGDNGFIQFE